MKQGVIAELDTRARPEGQGRGAKSRQPGTTDEARQKGGAAQVDRVPEDVVAVEHQAVDARHLAQEIQQQSDEELQSVVFADRESQHVPGHAAPGKEPGVEGVDEVPEKLLELPFAVFFSVETEEVVLDSVVGSDEAREFLLGPGELGTREQVFVEGVLVLLLQIEKIQGNLA